MESNHGSAMDCFTAKTGQLLNIQMIGKSGSSSITATATMAPRSSTRTAPKNGGSMGLLHRENGPAVEYPDGSKEWFLNHQRHRNDGPAIEDGRW